jgi:uncharacterized membrane protein (UPF0127 family)
MIVLSFMITPVLAGSSETIKKDGRLEFLNSKGSVIASIDIDIVETPHAHARGLMGVESMKLTQGMLFVYGEAEDMVFWMRNTPLSLDIIFISDTKEVINIAKNTVQMTDNRYRSEKPAQFVVEVISGFCEKYGIESGTRVRWKRYRSR